MTITLVVWVSLSISVKTQKFCHYLAQQTENWSGSFINDLVEAAALFSVMDNGIIEQKHFKPAFAKVAPQQQKSYQRYMQEFLKREKFKNE